MAGPAERRGVDDALRPACRLALDVARFGEQLGVPTSTPGALVSILRFHRLNATAYQTIARVVDEDEDFRRRVAAAAEETGVGRAGWLWLERPDGWQDEDAEVRPSEVEHGAGGDDVENDTNVPGEGDEAQIPLARDEVAIADHQEGPAKRRGRNGDRSAGAGEAKVSAKRLAKVEAALERHRGLAAEADERRRKATAGLAEVRRDRDDARSEAHVLLERVEVLEAQRNDAMRKFKAMEGDLNQTRAALRVARAATTEAETELRSLRASQGPPLPVAEADPETTQRSRPDASDTRADAEEDSWDRAAVADAITEAGHAAQAIARSLAAAANALNGRSGPDGVASGQDRSSRRLAGDRDPSEGNVRRTTGSRQKGGGGVDGDGARTRPRVRRSGRSRRAQPGLPPGAFDDSAEAERHLLLAGEAVVLVDGYNVARTTWPELAPEEERRRLVHLLEELQARSRGRITVVFDGETGTVAPQASRSVHVAFSATGVIADDDIAARLAEIPADQPVVVVSSDGEVMVDARRQGAVPMTTPAFLAAARR